MKDHTQASDNELALLLQSANAALAEANAARRIRVDELHSVQAEIARRRDARNAASYETRRREAVGRGEAPPEPPASIASPSPVRAARTRLSSIEMPKMNPEAAREAPRRPEAVAALESEIPTEVAVSDHAVVRYLERVVGFDVDGLRRRILTPTVRAAILSGVTRIRTPDGVIVARQGNVASYLPRDSGPLRRRGGGRIRDHERSDVRPSDADIMRDWHDQT